MPTGRLYTLGHSNRTIESLLAMLAEFGVTKLVDVRRYPRSRYNPHFNDAALRDALAGAGIGYRHAQALGGMRAATHAPSPNTGWKPGSFRNYADYALTPPFQDALATLEAEMRSTTVGIMCAEKDWRQCHRQIIADYLMSRDHKVTHLLAAGEKVAGTLDERVEVIDSGTLHYRPAIPRQGELF